MQHFIKPLRREEAGVWVFLEPATLDLPEGRIQVVECYRFTVGAKFMNVELARLLEDESNRTH